MELNETLQKVDMTLDSTVKKIEKQAKEIVNQELKIELSSGPKSTLSQPISIEILLIIYLVDVIEYIRTFKWEDSKYPRGKPLVEITGLIVEVLLTLTKVILNIIENESY